MIDDPTVNLLRYSLIEATVTCFHVENRQLAALRGNSGEATVGVTQHQECVKSVLGQQSIDFDDHLSDRLRGTLAGSSEKQIGSSDFEITEEDIVELRVVILAGMHEAVVAVLIEFCDYSGQANNLWPGSDDRYYLQAIHLASLGRLRSLGPGANALWITYSSPLGAWPARTLWM